MNAKYSINQIAFVNIFFIISILLFNYKKNNQTQTPKITAT
ncbi:hypothetical protein JCM19300_792 [Algibacter lectus]|uniref:Uncharacterized protein n=1 Tax=Algibacter lectus TaxID=221126 RepID=A0A090X4A4_9FLAO|nr:hypothetical protein JCM19300_792 [Algibacter lectus]GAL77437.1 hypothetical protein JCM19274_5150 [Algibacter lectus]